MQIMLNPELIVYIQEQTQQGVSAQVLRQSLMEVGWHERDIENALHDVAAGLSPVTPGASIHDDLTQVRGMVAHLAMRVKKVETELASVAALPSAFIGPDHELPRGSGRKWIRHAVGIIVIIVLMAWFGAYATQLVNQHSLAPADQIVIATALGTFLFVAALVAMRGRHAWAALLLAAGALALWAASVLAAQVVHAVIEPTVAIALGALLLALIFAVGRWIDRSRTE